MSSSRGPVFRGGWLYPSLFSRVTWTAGRGWRTLPGGPPPPTPADSQPPSQGLLTKLRSRHPQNRQEHPWGSKPQSPGRSRPSAPGQTVSQASALRSPPAWLLLSAGGQGLAEHGCPQWIPRVLVTAACLGQNKGTAFTAAAPRGFLGAVRTRRTGTHAGAMWI